MLTLLPLLLSGPSLAAGACAGDGQALQVLAAAPWRDGTLLIESCSAPAPGGPATGDWQRISFHRNGGGVSWTRALGTVGDTGEVWWTNPSVIPQDVDGDAREELVITGELSNCGEGGCVAGEAKMYLWPDVSDRGGDCGRRGFEEGERGRLLTWVSARYDVPGWSGPSWVRSTVAQHGPGELDITESWTAMPPSVHDPMVFRSRVYAGPYGVSLHCAGAGAPGL